MKGIKPTRMEWRVHLLVAAFALISYSAGAADLARLRNGFSIRHVHRQVIGENTRLFLSGDDSSYVDVPSAEIEGFEKDLSPPPTPSLSAATPANPFDLSQTVNSASATYHLDPDLVNSVIHAESGFSSGAVSRKGAKGLMQLMPGTAEKLGVTNPFDPEANVGGGTRYLRQLLERYNFDLVKALAAYNAGPQKVEQYQGVPPFRETRAYVTKVVRDYNRKKIAQEKPAAATTKQSKPPTTKSSAPRPTKPTEARNVSQH